MSLLIPVAGNNDPLVGNTQSSRVYPLIRFALHADAMEAGVSSTGIQQEIQESIQYP